MTPTGEECASKQSPRASVKLRCATDTDVPVIVEILKDSLLAPRRIIAAHVMSAVDGIMIEVALARSWKEDLAVVRRTEVSSRLELFSPWRVTARSASGPHPVVPHNVLGVREDERAQVEEQGADGVLWVSTVGTVGIIPADLHARQRAL